MKKEISIIVSPVVIPTVLFLTLKLLGKIDWSWWWVLSPIWISFLVLLVIILTVIVIAWLMDKNFKMFE